MIGNELTGLSSFASLLDKGKNNDWVLANSK